MTDQKVARWYFGGVSAATASVFTHPLDLLKVHLQTQRDVKKTMVQLGKEVVRKEGVRGLFNGISAALLRNGSYSTTRFAIYEVGRQKYKPHTVGQRIALAAGAGAIGGVIGTPGDIINVRMQNDMKLPVEKRRNYKHALDGIWRAYKEEGFLRLFTGVSTTSPRAAMMTIGQLATYDQFKHFVLKFPIFKDDVITHLLSSIMAGVTATILTQPIDIVKTRLMNAKPGEFRGPWDCAKFTAKEGIGGFFKGFLPSTIRMVPTTILTFLFYEQLRINFGYIPETKH